MQIPSASPKSLRQRSQLARGALLSRGDLPHPGGGHGLEGAAPRSRQLLAMPCCCWRCMEGSWQLLPRQNLRLRKETGGSGSGEGIARRTGCHCRRSAFLCERGRHQHILTAGFRRGKGHEKFES